MIRIALLGSLKNDVPTLLSAAQQGLGRSLSTTLDQRGSDVTTQASWLALLAALKAPQVSPESVIQNPGNLSRHAFFSFLVVATPATFPALIDAFEIALTWTPTPNGLGIGVLSGTLAQLSHAVIIGGSQVVDYDLRDASNQIMNLLESQGFSRLWCNYGKRTQPDGTFKLLEKK